MRIAFLGPSYPWRGGIAQFAQNLAEKLLGRQHEIMMFTFIHQYPALLFPGSQQFDETGKPPNLATQRILTPYNPFTWLSAVNDIKGWNPDALIVSYWLPFMAPAFGFIIRHLPKVKKIYLIHNARFHEKWLFAEQLTRYAMRPADGFITLSEASSKDLLKVIDQSAKDKILQLFHPVYEQLLLHQEQVQSHQKRILFFGFVKHYKGLDILLEAMPEVIKQIPELKLVIAGDVYGDKKVYWDKIIDLCLKDNVEAHFRYIPDEQIEGFFTGCDVCVLPYRSATQSGVAQMAFAYEVPVIATKVGGIEEVVIDGENGLLAEPENALDLAKKIIGFYSQDIASRFRDNIRSQNEQFSWDAFTKRVLDYLQ